MRIVEYSPDHFPDLSSTMSSLRRGRSLNAPLFVDHYYHGNPWAKLLLAIGDDGRSVLGTLGFESIPFLLGGKVTPISFGSNFHTLHNGCGGLLFLKWIRSNPAAMVFNCSPDTQKLISPQGWNRLGGVQILSYNAPPTRVRGQSALTFAAKSLAKALLRHPPLHKVAASPKFMPEHPISVSEVPQWNSSLLDFESAYGFRIAPDMEYLRWRYPTGWIPFRYRIFAVARAGETRGFVVIHDAPRQVLVAHADGAHPMELLKAQILALAQISDGRPALVSSSDPAVTSQLTRSGFRIAPTDPCIQFSPKFAIGLVDRPLLHFGLGDNDLRTDYMWGHQNGGHATSFGKFLPHPDDDDPRPQESHQS